MSRWKPPASFADEEDGKNLEGRLSLLAARLFNTQLKDCGLNFEAGTGSLRLNPTGAKPLFIAGNSQIVRN